MKRTLIVTALFLSLALLGSQVGTAGPRCGRGNNGPGNCQFTENCNCPNTEAGGSPEARQAFLDATSDLRNQLFEKRQAYDDVLRQDQVDKEKASKLWSEIFDIQAQLREKAVAAGLPAGLGNCRMEKAMMGKGCCNGPKADGCNRGCGKSGCKVQGKQTN